MGKKKRHHFVPEFLIRNFSNDLGRVWYYERESSNVDVVSRRPRSAHWSRHLYSELTAEGVFRPELEEKYSKAESFWEEVISKVISQARSGDEIKITSEERFILTDFFIHQFKRVPDNWKSIDSYKTSALDLREEILRNLDNSSERYREVSDWGEEDFLRILNNARLVALTSDNKDIRSIMDTKDLVVGVATDQKSSFVLGSSPIGRWGDSGGQHLSEENVELSMPISADVVLGYTGKSGRIFSIEIGNRTDMRRFNEGIWRISQSICGRSKPLIESLTGYDRRRQRRDLMQKKI